MKTRSSGPTSSVPRRSSAARIVSSRGSSSGTSVSCGAPVRGAARRRMWAARHPDAVHQEALHGVDVVDAAGQHPAAVVGVDADQEDVVPAGHR